MAVVEAELALLEVQVEGLLPDAIEAGQAPLGIAPVGLDAVDVALAPCEFVLSVVDPGVLLVAHVHEPVVGLPSVAVDGASLLHMAADHLEQRGFAAIGKDFGEYLPGSLQDAKDDGLASSTSAALPAHAGGSEVGFVNLHLPREWRLDLAGFSQSLPDPKVDRIHGSQAEADHRRSFCGRQIQRKAPQKVAEFHLRNL